MKQIDLNRRYEEANEMNKELDLQLCEPPDPGMQERRQHHRALTCMGASTSLPCVFSGRLCLCCAEDNLLWTYELNLTVDKSVPAKLFEPMYRLCQPVKLT